LNAAGEWTAAGLGAVLALVTVGWAGTGQGVFPWWPLGSAIASVGASAGLLAWLAAGSDRLSDRSTAWVLGLAAAAVLGLGSEADYELWFPDTRMWTVGCYAFAFLLVAGAGLRGGWAGGLRAALVAHLGSTAAILFLFRWYLGAPVQTAVFQASGLLDAYESSGGSDFTRWAADSFLGMVLPRTLVALVAGAALGAGTGWIRSRFRKS